MPAGLAAGRAEKRREPHGHHVHKVNRFHSRTHKSFKDTVVPVKDSQHTPAESPAGPCQGIVVPRLAFVAAELLVRPAISDLVPAFKADRDMPFLSLVIHPLYPPVSYQGKYHKQHPIFKQRKQGFSFSYHNFLLFLS